MPQGISVVKDAERLQELSIDVLFLVMLIFFGGTLFMTNKSKIPLPYTVILFMYGIFVGFLMYYIAPDVSTALGNIPPELIFYIFLPVLIFEGSYAMNVHALRLVFPQVLLLASVGVLINTAFLALTVVWLFPNWSWYTALLLGSLLSATDPVAVVSLLKGLGVDKRITAMVDGEAIMNDGTAIIAFKLLLSAASTRNMEDKTFSIMLKIVHLAILPVLIGPIFGFLQSYWLRRARSGLIRACVTVSVTYITYYVAGHIIGTSAVLTLFFSGIFLSYYCPSLFPGREGNLIYEIWEFLVHLGNTVLFSLVGVILVVDVVPTLNLLDVIVIVCMYSAMIAARFLMLLILLPILNLFAFQFSIREVAMLVHAGLRGGVAVTLALAVLQAGVEEGVEILKITCGVVLLTLCINATTAEKVVSILGHKRREQHQIVQMNYAVEHLGYVTHKALKAAKNNSFYRTANWAAAEDYIRENLSNPYQKMSTLPEDDDVVLNRLLMRAFRASIWRQRDNDLISETVALTITHVVAHNVESGCLIEVNDLFLRKPYPGEEITSEEEIQLIQEKLLPLWVSFSERFLGKGYWDWAYLRVQQNAFMTLLSFARCLADVEPIKYQYVKNTMQGRRIEMWITSQREEVHRIIRLFYETCPEATMYVATSRTVLRVVDDIHKEVRKLHDSHGFGIKTTAVLEEMVRHMHENIPRSWDVPKRDNELVIAALASTPFGRGLHQDEINALCSMGFTRDFKEDDEIVLDDKDFYVVVFGSLKPKHNRWTASNLNESGFGSVIGLEAFVIPPQLRQGTLNRWVVTSTECQLFCISYGCIKPFLQETSFASVKAFWRAVAVETLPLLLESMITLPSNLEESSHDHLTAIIMGGKPLIGPAECNTMDWSLQFHLCFYLRGSDTNNLFRNEHTSPCYISALFAQKLRWEDPQVVLYAVPVNVSDIGYVPWVHSKEGNQPWSSSAPKNSSVKVDMRLVSDRDSFLVERSTSTYAEAADIFGSILCGRIPGENRYSSHDLVQTLEIPLSFDEENVCVLQNPVHFVTDVPYVNQLFLRYATVLEGLCIAALRYVRIPSDPLNVRHAHYISEQTLEFLMIFCNELSLLCLALRRHYRLTRSKVSTTTTATTTLYTGTEEEEEDKNELEDMKMMCKVIMWRRAAEIQRTFELKAMVLHMKLLANRRFHDLSKSLRDLAMKLPSLKNADSVEELQRILLSSDS